MNNDEAEKMFDKLKNNLDSEVEMMYIINGVGDE